MTAEAPGVSPTTEQALRAAMERLLTGHPKHTDGKLTKNNLHREAGISRATMNRAKAILTEWDMRTSESPAAERERRREGELTEVRGKLRRCLHEKKRLQDQVDAAATVITTLLAENAALREHLAKRSAVVVPLSRAGTARE